MNHEKESGLHSSDDKYSFDTDSQESRVARAWDALEQIHNRVTEVTPEASEQEIAAQVGDYVADTMLHDVDQAAADDRITAEEAEPLQEDSFEVLLQGGIEDDLSIPLDENPITHVAEAGHDALLADAATEISREDPETGTQSAILLGRAKERSDRTRLTVPSRHEEPDPHVEGNETPEAEATPAEAMQTYLDRLDVEYRQRLADLFASCLHNLSAAETAFILSNEELRNKTAYAVQKLDVDRSILDLGDFHETPYVPKDPEIAKRAMELEARAIQVNAWFQTQTADIARETGSLHRPGLVKDVHRIAEKMEKDYSDDRGEGRADIELLASRVKDAVRCRLVVDGDPTLADQPIIDKIKESGLRIAEDSHHHPIIKRGFRNRRTGEPLEIESGTSYRDTKVTVTVTVEVPTRDGGITLCEIAIVTPEMGTATVAEHPIYEITRSLAGDDVPPAALTLVRTLRAIQTEFYRKVAQQIANRLANRSD